MGLIKSIKWSFFSESASKLIAPLVFIILSRLLTPDDFGVMTSALMVIGFSQIFWEAGMGKALIQKRTEVLASSNVAFWINIVLGLLISISLFLISDFIAHSIFKDLRVSKVLKIMTLHIFLGSLSSVQTALLQKDMKFKKLFWVRFSTVSLPSVVSIPMALYGMGYWALVGGVILGQLSQVILLWKISKWRPNFSFNFRLAKDISRFGIWVCGAGLLTWFFAWVDSFIIGIYLGSHDLGIYRNGNQFAQLTFTLLFSPASAVLYSYFSKMNKNKSRIREASEKVIKVLILISVPLGISIYTFSYYIEAVIFGEKWEGIGLVIGIMSLMHGFSWIVGMNGEIYRSVGKPSYETIVTGSLLIVYLVAYLISIKFGFNIFLWTRLGLALVALVFHMYVLKKAINIKFSNILNYFFKILLICCVITIALDYFMNEIHISNIQYLFFVGFLNVFLLAFALYFSERKKMVYEIKNLIKNQK